MNLSNHLTPEEAGERCRVSAEAVRHWIRSGVTILGRRVKLAAVRVGNNYRIDPDALQRFIEACNAGAPAAPLSEAKGAARRKAAQESLAKEIGGGL